ncbi:HEPN domain-containing protein [Thermococcus sp. 18S1]|uniref:HEPN domain-containing protein n=1 Tax=Thermococcus sp. 18S1 TaxID=1638210 RepID=UPI001F0D11F8|nr:HEPN domain-containing protein [Thermococcus sp. 18S1]
MRPDVAAWIKRAEEDLFTAEALLSFKKPAPWIICFHAQQAAEKFLKAFGDFLGPKPERELILLAAIELYREGEAEPRESL